MLSQPVAVFRAGAFLYFSRCEHLNAAYIHQDIVRVDLRDRVLPHIEESEVGSKGSTCVDHRRVLSIPIFRKC